MNLAHFRFETDSDGIADLGYAGALDECRHAGGYRRNRNSRR